MFCPKCGTRIGDSDSFCRSCGARIDAVSENNSSGGAGRFLGKATASYALGKLANAAIDSTGIGIPKRNPNADRYMEIQKEASSRPNLSQRMKNKDK